MHDKYSVQIYLCQANFVWEKVPAAGFYMYFQNKPYNMQVRPEGCEAMDLVIFDCDGVLIDSEIISAEMLVKELKTVGISIDRSYVTKHFLGRSYPTVFSTIRSDFGIVLSDEFEESYRNRLLAAFEAQLTAVPFIERALRNMTIAWCVATSSSPQRAERSLVLTGLRGLVGERLFTANMVSKGKPAPDLFLFAAEKMGVTPERCLVIEDSLNGVKAGLSAGMQVWRFTGGSHMRGQDLAEPAEQCSHFQFDDFSNFHNLLYRAQQKAEII